MDGLKNAPFYYLKSILLICNDETEQGCILAKEYAENILVMTGTP